MGLADELLERETVRVACSGAGWVGWQEIFFVERWIGQDAVERDCGSETADVGLHYLNAPGKWRGCDVFPGLFHRRYMQLHTYDFGTGPLGRHEGYESGACTYVEDAACLFDFGPRPQQHAVRAHLHGAAVMANAKVLEIEVRHVRMYL